MKCNNQASKSLRFIDMKSISYAIFLAILYLTIAFFCAGRDLVQYFPTHIPTGIADGSAKGDHIACLERLLLVKYNLINGHSPYYWGYGLNIDDQSRPLRADFTLFPFSVFTSILAFTVGDIIAYNLMFLLSYILCGISCFWLVWVITKQSHAALITSLFYVCFPFRIQHVYEVANIGLIFCLTPLPILFLEKAIGAGNKKYLALFSLSYFLIATAEAQVIANFLKSQYLELVFSDKDA